jgi:hypothetical protein
LLFVVLLEGVAQLLGFRSELQLLLLQILLLLRQYLVAINDEFNFWKFGLVFVFDFLKKLKVSLI